MQKRARGRPRIHPPVEDRKHRDLGAYNLFVMKAQNVAGAEVKNYRAFMALIGAYWKVRAMHTLVTHPRSTDLDWRLLQCMV